MLLLLLLLCCAHPWKSLVEEDEQTDQPKSKQMWNVAMHVLHNFGFFDINATAFHLGRYNLQLLLLKSSMAQGDGEILSTNSAHGRKDNCWL